MITRRPRWSNDPFPMLSNMLENFFEEAPAVSTPAVNVSETGENFRIEVAAPGLKKEDFKVNLDNNVITISSEKKSEAEDQNERFTRREFSYSSFERSFVLPDSADPERVEAKYDSGVLKLNIPKKEMAIKKGPRQISISESPASTRSIGEEQSAKPEGRAPGSQQKGQSQTNTAQVNQEDRQKIREDVAREAERDTGKPTGAIYGNQGDERSVSNSFQE